MDEVNKRMEEIINEKNKSSNKKESSEEESGVR
jgi:hypothetical protein